MTASREKYSKEFADSVMLMSGPPKTGQFYQHYNGNVYYVVAVTDEQPGYPSNVVHQGKNGKFWTREIGTWYQSMMRVELTEDEIAAFYIQVAQGKVAQDRHDDFERREAAFRKELVDLCNTYKVAIDSTGQHTYVVDNSDNDNGVSLEDVL